MQNLDPTYLRYIYDNLIKGSVHPENTSELPEGLIGLYEEAFEEHLPVLERQQLLQRFALFALLKKEVSANFISEILEESEDDIKEFIVNYVTWFNSTDPGQFQLYHQRLKVFVLQKLSEKEIQTIHEKLIARLELAIEEQQADEFERYGLEFLSNKKYTKAIFGREECDFIQFSLDANIWQRQRLISKDFAWSKKMIGEVMLYQIQRNGDGLSKSIFSLLKIGWIEQNEYQVILNLVKNKEFELCRQKLYFFGGRTLSAGKRRFLIILKIIDEILTIPLELADKKKFAIIFLEFMESEISSEKHLFNWKEYLPVSYILNTVNRLFKIEVSPVAIINKTNKLEFDDQCRGYINAYNLRLVFECIEKSNLTQIDKYASQLNLCEFAIKIGVDNYIVKSCLIEVLSKSDKVKNNVGSKLCYRKLINALLVTESYTEILSSSFFQTTEYEELLIEAVSLHILKHDFYNLDLIHPIISKFKFSNQTHLFNSLVAFILNGNEIELFMDESFKAQSNKCKLLIHAVIFLKDNRMPKFEMYWSQLILELQNQSKSKPNSSIENELFYIFEILESKDYYHEINDLIDIFNDLFNEELLLKFISLVNLRDRGHLGKHLSEVLLKKVQTSDEYVSFQVFYDSLISLYHGDVESVFSNIEKIDNIFHKDFLFKLLLKGAENNYRLVGAYLKFNFLVSKVKTSDSKMQINALKYLEDLKLGGEGKIYLFELKKKIEQLRKKPVHFFQFSQAEYLYEIIHLLIKNGNLQYAQKFEYIEKNPSTSDLLLYESKKRLILEKQTEIDNEFVDQFRTKKMKRKAQQFISKVQYQRDGNLQETLNTLSTIDSVSDRIQGYFNCIQVSIDKNHPKHQPKLFDLIEQNFKNFGHGDIFQKGKDKFERLDILTTNSFLLFKIQKNDFLIEQLKLFSLKDRFLAYLKIAEKCLLNDEKDFSRKLFKRVLNQLNKIENISDAVELRCEIIELSAKFKFESVLNDIIQNLKETVENCCNERTKSEFALRIVISFVKAKKYKRGYEFYFFLSNIEDKFELLNFIGNHFKSTIHQIHSSDLNCFFNSITDLQMLAKSKISKLKIDECSESNLSYAYFVRHDNETLYKIFTDWFLNELFFRNTPIEELSDYTELINLQWAIDLKKELDQIQN